MRASRPLPSLVLCAASAFSLLVPGSSASAAPAPGRNIGLAPGGDIAAAIARAGTRGTVTLADGTYRPDPITVGPSAAGVTLRARAAGKARIDFQGRGGFYIKADGFTLRGLAILNAKNFAVDLDASDCTVERCTVLGSGGDAIKLSPGPWQQKRYHRGAAIRACEIGGNRDFEGIDCVGHDDVRIVDCYIHDTPGWGVYLKGGAARGLVERCVFARCGLKASNPKGGVCLGEHTGPPAIMTNKHGKPWESVEGTVRNCVFVDIPSAAMAAWCARGARFVNNTCVDAATRDRAALIVLGNHGLPSTDVAFVNNIVVGSKAGNRPLVWIYAGGAEGNIVFENNCYFGGNGRFWHQAAGDPVDFERWQSAHGFDAKSRFADPELDASLHLAPGSPCIDAGRTVEGFDGDYDGARRAGAWDIGADESGAGPVRPLPARERRQLHLEDTPGSR
jgi:hypothetical protein